MSRLFRIVAILFGGVLALGVCGVAAFAMFFDANAYRDLLARRVEQATGRALRIGDLHVAIWPAPGLRLREVRLANAAGFAADPLANPMVDVGEVELGFQLWPLLTERRVEFGKIWIKHAQLNLARNAQGQSNWDDLKALASHANAVPTTSVPAGADHAAPEVASKMPELQFSGFEIRDSGLSFVDQSAAAPVGGLRENIQQLDASIGALQAGQSVPVKVKAHLDLSKPALVGQLETSMNLSLLPKVQRLSAQNGQLKFLPDTAANNAAAAGLNQPVNLSWSAVSVDGHAGTAALTDGELSVAGAVIHLQLNAEGLTAAEGSATDGAAKALHYWGPIRLDPVSPRAVLAALGRPAPNTPDVHALENVSFSTTINGGRGAVDLRDVKAQLDQTQISGEAALADVASHRVTFKLAVDQLDVDRYIKLGKAGGEARAEGRAAAEHDAGHGAEHEGAHAGEAHGSGEGMQALDALNVDGVLTAGRLKIREIALSDVQLKVQATPGSAKALQLGAHAYRGTIASATTLTPGTTPHYAQTLKLQDLDVGPFLHDLTGNSKLEGHGDVTANLDSAGSDGQALRRHLNGKFSANLRDGVIHGGNIGQWIKQEKNAPVLSAVTAIHDTQDTKFSTMALAATIVNGVLTTDVLDAQTDSFKLGGKGSIDLAERTLDYWLEPTFQVKRGGALLQGLLGGGDGGAGGIVVPIHLTGSLDAPAVHIELEKAKSPDSSKSLRDRLMDRLAPAGGGSGSAASGLQGNGPSNGPFNGALRDRLRGFLGGGAAASSSSTGASAGSTQESTTNSAAPTSDSSATP